MSMTNPLSVPAIVNSCPNVFQYVWTMQHDWRYGEGMIVLVIALDSFSRGNKYRWHGSSKFSTLLSRVNMLIFDVCSSYLWVKNALRLLDFNRPDLLTVSQNAVLSSYLSMSMSLLLFALLFRCPLDISDLFCNFEVNLHANNSWGTPIWLSYRPTSIKRSSLVAILSLSSISVGSSVRCSQTVVAGSRLMTCTSPFLRLIEHIIGPSNILRSIKWRMSVRITLHEIFYLPQFSILNSPTGSSKIVVKFSSRSYASNV